MKFSCNSIVLSFELPPFASFLMGHTVADVVDALESGDDLFVMGDDDDGGLELPSHVIEDADYRDRKSTRLNSSHQIISYAVFCLKKKKIKIRVSNATYTNRQISCVVQGTNIS